VDYMFKVGNDHYIFWDIPGLYFRASDQDNQKEHILKIARSNLGLLALTSLGFVLRSGCF
jgi:hypothetical protein